MLRLTLLCHGATAANRLAAFPANEPLEARALTAARALGPDRSRTVALTSPALRARQTAEALGLAARVEPLIRECDYGRWSGLSLAAVSESQPEAFAAFMTDPRAAPHGGESIADVAERTAAWLAGLLPSEGRIVAVTHAAVVRTALLHVLAAPLDAFWRIDVAPLSVVDIVSDGRRWAWRAPASTQARMKANAGN